MYEKTCKLKSDFVRALLECSPSTDGVNFMNFACLNLYIQTVVQYQVSHNFVTAFPWRCPGFNTVVPHLAIIVDEI